MKKITFMLVLAMLSGMVSCGSTGSGQPTDGTTSGGDGGDISTEPEKTGVVQKLTDAEKVSLGLDGYEFNVMTRSVDSYWAVFDMSADAETGDTMNDAVYRRNMYLEDKCGFTLKTSYSADSSCSEINTYILSGDDAFDAYFPSARQAGSAATDGLLYDLYTLPRLDLDNDCWNSMFSDTLNYGGKLFYATGAITTNGYDSIRLFMFNKTIAGKSNLADPYEMVRNGKWTIDAFNEMATGAAQDLNGDTEMTLDDQWGMAWQKYIGGVIFYYGSGEFVTTMDSENHPQVAVGGARSTEVYGKIRDMISDKKVYYQGEDADILQAFYDGHSLFLTEVLDAAKRLRPYDVTFGILPVPKYDEAQEEYIQYVDGWCLSPVVVPVNASNPERTGFIIEAIAEESKNYLSAPYYDTVLNGKVLRDDESSEMLDIVLNNFVLDNCDLYQWSGMMDTMKDAMTNGKELASVIASSKSALGNAIKKTTEAIG